jgi:pimeloyl-ACP methyl ester carboxylesterase
MNTGSASACSALGEAFAASTAAGLYLTGLSDRLSNLLTTSRTTGAGRATRQFPVLLVHGLCGNRAWSLSLARALTEDGYATRAINYRTFGCGLEQSAAQIAAAADQLRRDYGTNRVHVVGHSLGGLAVRAAEARHSLAGRLAGAVTLASPHRGSPWAATAAKRLPGFGEILAQITPGSAYLQHLDADTTRDDATSWTAIYSTADEIVPGHHGRLDPPILNATNLQVPAVGHLAITTNSRTHKLVCDALDQAETHAASDQRPAHQRNIHHQTPASGFAVAC